MIRKIKLTDKLVFEILGKEIKPDFSTSYKLEEILKKDYEKVLVYELNNQVVGFIHYELLYEDLSIINLVVDPNFRRQDIASSLLEYVFQNNKEAHFILEVRSDNLEAINLYQKYNFKVINIRPKYYGDVDALIMERR